MRWQRSARPLQCGKALLEGAHCRVGEARIDVARDLAGETRCCLGGTAEYIAGGGEDRLRLLGLGCADLSSAHGQGIETIFINSLNIAASSH